MCKLHINDRVNVVNHSNNVSKSNDSTICVPTYRQSQFSILDGLGCSVSDQSQIINLNAESLDSCLDGLDCITSIMQSQTINSILDGLDYTTSVVQSQKSLSHRLIFQPTTWSNYNYSMSTTQWI